MSGFIKKILVFGVVFVLVAAAIEIRVCYTFNELSYKREYMEKHADGIKTLLIGASNTANGIDPSVIGDSCFNLAVSGQSLHFTTVTSEKFLPSCAHLKNVILTIPHFMLYGSYNYPLAETSNDVYASEKCSYLKYMGIMEDATDWIYWPETIWHKQGIIFRCFKDFVTCDTLGFEHCRLSERGGRWKIAGIPPTDIKDELGNAELAFEENVRNVRTIARLCKERGARLILVSTPYYETAQKATSEKHRAATRRFVEEVRKGGYDNVVYREYTFDPRFSDDDFFNANHLNEHGAAKFAEILRTDFNL